MEDKKFYNSLYRALTIKYTGGNTNNQKILNKQEQEELDHFFLLLKTLYTYLQSLDQNPNRYLLQKIVLIYLKSIKPLPKSKT